MYRFTSNCLRPVISRSNLLQIFISSLKFEQFIFFRSHASFLQAPTRKIDLGGLSDNRKATKEVNDLL
jgi:hypothetical protein